MSSWGRIKLSFLTFLIWLKFYFIVFFSHCSSFVHLFLPQNAIIHCQGNSVLYVAQICICFTLLVLVPARMSVTNSFILITSCPTYLSVALQVDLVLSQPLYGLFRNFNTLNILATIWAHWTFRHLFSFSFGKSASWMWMQLCHESSRDSYTRQPVRRVLVRKYHRDGIHYIFFRHCHWRHYRRQFHLKCTEHCVHFNNHPEARGKKNLPTKNMKHIQKPCSLSPCHFRSYTPTAPANELEWNMERKKLSMFSFTFNFVKNDPCLIRTKSIYN